MAPRRTLLLARDMVGDLVNTTGAVNFLRRSFPETHFVLEGGRVAAELFPGMDVLIRTRGGGLQGKIRRVQAYRRGKFDAAIVLDDSREAVRLARFAGIGQVFGGPIGFAGTAKPPWAQPEAHHDLFAALEVGVGAYARARGVEFTGADLAPTLPLKGDLTKIAGWIFHISASDPAKEWPEPQWVELARQWSGWVAGGPGDGERVRRIADSSGRPVLPEMGLLDYAARIQQAEGLVTADTGPAHLAGAVGTPCVVLYGPTDPARFHPWGDRWTAIRKITECEHYGHGCAFREGGVCSRKCMSAIPVADVLQALSPFRVR